MKKKWAYINRRIAINVIPGYSFDCMEYSGRIDGRYHSVLLETAGQKLPQHITHQSLCNVKEQTEEQVRKIRNYREFLDRGLMKLVEEIRDIHDDEILRVCSDAPNKPTPEQKRVIERMLEYGQKEIEDFEKSRAERGNLHHDGTPIESLLNKPK
jgi:hypothetical protein